MQDRFEATGNGWDWILAKQQFETINALRGLAAILVVMFHAARWFGWMTPREAFLCVDLFFMMSGFVIAHSYETRLSSGLKPGQFTLARLIRLYPLYILGFTLAVVARSLEPFFFMPVPWFAAQVFMLPAPTYHFFYPVLYIYNHPAWSLLYEILINILYAYTWRLWSIPNIVLVVTGAAILMLVSPHFHGDGGDSWNTVNFGLFRIFYAFPAGVLIYRLRGRLSAVTPSVSGLIIVPILPLALIAIPNFTWQACYFLVFHILLTFAIVSRTDQVTSHVFNMLGTASYAIYVIHMPLISITSTLLPLNKTVLNGRLVGFAFIALLIPLSIFVDFIYDGPVRGFLTRRLLPPRGATP